MVLIRPFEECDNAWMLDIEKLCPQGNEKYAWGVDKSPDAIARYKLYDNWKVLVAEEERKIAGWIGWTVKHYTTQKEQYVYLTEVLTEVMIHPKFRRKGIATQLVKEAEKNAREIGSSHIYCYIFGPNEASKALFEKLDYSNMGEIKSCGLTVYKKANIAKKYTIERTSKSDIPDVVSLIQVVMV